jgi:hypothetical protein
MSNVLQVNPFGFVGWEVLNTPHSVILMNLGTEKTTLIEIMKDHLDGDPNVVVLDNLWDPNFDEDDAGTVASAILAMDHGWEDSSPHDHVNIWTGEMKALLPVTFSHEDSHIDLLNLAALVYSWHKPTLRIIEDGVSESYTYFNGFRWRIRIKLRGEDKLLDSITIVGEKNDEGEWVSYPETENA